jgi:hypothetical protein
MADRVSVKAHLLVPPGNELPFDHAPSQGDVLHARICLVSLDWKSGDTDLPR